jgi:flagellar motor protein MotB
VKVELKSKAVQYDKKKDIYNAIFYYHHYLTLNSKDVKLSYRLATLYYQTRNYAGARQFYDSVLTFNNKKFPEAYYYKGIVCLNLQKYDEALEAFTKFRKAYHKSNDKKNLSKLASIYSECATWAKVQPNDEGTYAVVNAGMFINHPSLDFAPFPVDENTLIYGAVYSDSTQNIAPVRQIFKAVRSNGQWKSTGLWEGSINQPTVNTGNAVVSDDGQRIYFTRSLKNWQGVNVNEIFVSNYNGSEWSNPQKLPYPVNDENYTNTQPALGKNLRSGNDILYFVSNRPGGKGGLDIWYSEYNSKTQLWSEPHPLDKNVNTIGDDCCPFYDITNRTLYYSSNGRKNCLGGFDIFKVIGSGRKWTDAMPMPQPINSSFDDYYFSILKSNKEGFFTSNRPGSLTFGNGSCCDDIYSFKLNDCAQVHSFGTVRNSINPDIYYNLNEKYHLGLQFPKDSALLPNVPAELYLSDEKGNEEFLISRTTTNYAGNYQFELERNKHYRILLKNYGYFDKWLTVNTSGINCSDTIDIGTTLINYLPKANIRVSIYYDLGKFKLSDSAQKVIDSVIVPLFSLFPNAILEIGSHTDSVGSDEYNLNLSQKRSESVVNYLIYKNISKERLVAKGYGMRFPIAPNKNADGSDNLAGMSLNRRTEIKVVGEFSTFNLDE